MANFLDEIKEFDEENYLKELKKNKDFKEKNKKTSKRIQIFIKKINLFYIPELRNVYESLNIDLGSKSENINIRKSIYIKRLEHLYMLFITKYKWDECKFFSISYHILKIQAQIPFLLKLYFDLEKEYNQGKLEYIDIDKMKRKQINIIYEDPEFMNFRSEVNEQELEDLFNE